MEKKQTPSETEIYKAELKHKLTKIKGAMTPAVAVHALGRYYNKETTSISHIVEMYAATQQILFTINYIEKFTSLYRLVAAVEALAENVSGERGSIESITVNPPRSLLARTITNGYTEVCKREETDLRSAAKIFASSLGKIRDNGEGGRAIFNLIKADISAFMVKDPRLTELTLFKAKPIVNLDENGRAAVLFLVDALTENKVLDKSFLYQFIVGRSIMKTHPYFMGLLHQHLIIENDEEYLFKRGSMTERFLENSILSMIGLLEELTVQNGPESNAARINAAINTAHKTNKALPFKIFIDIANHLTPSINAQIKKYLGAEELNRLDARDINSLTEAFRRIFYTAYSGIEQSEEDFMAIDIITAVLDQGLKAKQEQRVITLGDIIINNPQATPAEIDRILAQVQKGKTINQASAWYREQRQYSKTAYWKKFKSGYGVFS